MENLFLQTSFSFVLGLSPFPLPAWGSWASFSCWGSIILGFLSYCEMEISHWDSFMANSSRLFECICCYCVIVHCMHSFLSFFLWGRVSLIVTELCRPGGLKHFYVNVCVPEYMHAHHMHTEAHGGGQKMCQIFLELKTHHVGAGNGTQIICSSSKWS